MIVAAFDNTYEDLRSLSSTAAKSILYANWEIVTFSLIDGDFIKSVFNNRKTSFLYYPI